MMHSDPVMLSREQGTVKVVVACRHTVFSLACGTSYMLSGLTMHERQYAIVTPSVTPSAFCRTFRAEVKQAIHQVYSSAQW